MTLCQQQILQTEKEAAQNSGSHSSFRERGDAIKEEEKEKEAFTFLLLLLSLHLIPMGILVTARSIDSLDKEEEENTQGFLFFLLVGGEEKEIIGVKKGKTRIFPHKKAGGG